MTRKRLTLRTNGRRSRFSSAVAIDRATLEEDLRQARTHAAVAKENVERQRQIVAGFERDGRDASQAQALLGTFERLEALHVAYIKRLEAEIQEE